MINVNNGLMSGIRFVDLFAGMGGFHLALSSLGAKCVFASEWDPAAQEMYEKNFGMRPAGDITKIDEKGIPDHDILCAGFPCQAFSISGKRRGFEDTRGTLFFDVARIIREKRPKVAFLENVKNFATHDKGNTLNIVRDTLIKEGYSVHYAVLNPVHYGTPQKRERIYIIAIRDDIHGHDVFHFPEPFPLKRSVEDFLLAWSQVRRQVINRDDIMVTEYTGEKSDKIIRIGQVGQGRQGERIYSPRGVSITFSAYGGGAFSKTGGYLIDGEVRKLHPREAARIMGYPDSHLLHPRDRVAYQQLGNSVIVDVLQLIAQRFDEFLI